MFFFFELKAFAGKRNENFRYPIQHTHTHRYIIN